MKPFKGASAYATFFALIGSNEFQAQASTVNILFIHQNFPGQYVHIAGPWHSRVATSWWHWD